MESFMASYMPVHNRQQQEDGQVSGGCKPGNATSGWQQLYLPTFLLPLQAQGLNGTAVSSAPAASWPQGNDVVASTICSNPPAGHVLPEQSSWNLPAPELSLEGRDSIDALNSVPILPRPVRSMFDEASNPSPAVVQDDKLERRRKRCAESSRRVRRRKRNEELDLQDELASLVRENERLRALVSREIPDKAQEIIGECSYKLRGEGFFHGNQSSKLGRSDFELIESLSKTRQSFVLTDPRLPDNPIVFASCAFLKLTGYSREQVIGRNCRFLQGIETDNAPVSEIRKAIASGKDCSVCLLNYKADGTKFWNQFFVAALRDRDGRIVNYVGVQSPVNSSKISTSYQKKEEDAEGIKVDIPTSSVEQIKTDPAPPIEPMLDGGAADIGTLDWAELAELFETDCASLESSSVGDEASSIQMANADLDEGKDPSEPAGVPLSVGTTESQNEQLEQLPDHPFQSSCRQFVAQTVRSEVVTILLDNGGDVTNPRFISALDVLHKVFKASINFDAGISSMLNGSWKSISQPSFHYGGCLGTNERGDFVYTLGKMCFNLFKPGDSRCTVQQTMTSIKPVGKLEDTPRVAPWSLRRELAMHEDPESVHANPNTLLKTYDIAIALTIEPGQFGASPGERIPSPPCRLKAAHVVHGYFLPDPETRNRLTVWFTGGELTPQSVEGRNGNDDQSFGDLAAWKDYFGAEYRRTWRESISVFGAKLFLGAELPHEMEPNGKMSYTLHRPYGGHGKGYVDVLYADEELLIVKGNSGTIHVMVSDDTQPVL